MVWHHRRDSIRTYLRQQIGYGRAEALLESKWPQKYNNIGHMKWNGRIYGNGLTKSFGWKKYRIYYGSFGSAPFQSLYGHCPTFLQSLPLMPEWYMLNLALLVLSLLGLLWSPLLIALPIFAVTAGLPFVNIVRTAQEISFADRSLSGGKKLKLRFLIGLFHMLQPMARLYGRLRHGLSPWRRRNGLNYAIPWPLKYAIWSEQWHTTEYWVKRVKTAILKEGAIVKHGGNYDDWDLEICAGSCSAVKCRVGVEEHGGGKQLIRFRLWPRVNVVVLALGAAFIVLSIMSAIGQYWLVSLLLSMLPLLLTFKIMEQCALAAGVCKKVFTDQVNQVKTETEERAIVMREKSRPENPVHLNTLKIQGGNILYSGPERRKCKDRRNGSAAEDSYHLRHDNFLFAEFERRSGIERRNGLAHTAASN
jgi:hypothetical protein